MTEAISAIAPAKINLGLEILRKRTDGYHDIRTVMTALDLVDTISICPSADSRAITIEGVSDVKLQDNLIYKAIQRFAEATDTHAGYKVTIEKRIPSPGGLGGASSDAAATLIALNRLHGDHLSGEQLHLIAASLGSDVPFFLGRSPALASGTGTELELLPFVSGYAVLVLPNLRLASKTATLYGSLTPEDLGDGERATAVAMSLRAGDLPNASLLANAFSRALYALAPELRDLANAMISSGAPYAALSGAGPAHYVLFDQQDDAKRLATTLDGRLGPGTRVALTNLINNHPQPR